MDNLWKRILTGKKGAEKPASDKPESPSRSDPPKAVERVLDVPLSRRRVLGGAATTVGHMASTAAMPQSPLIIKEGVSELASRLAPGVGEIWQLSNRLLGVEGSFLGISKEMEAVFSSGLPLNAEGKIDIKTLDAITSSCKTVPLDSIHNVSFDLTLQDFKNPEVLAQALRVSGPQNWQNDPTQAAAAAKRICEGIGRLQEVLRVPDTGTLRDLRYSLENKIIGVVGNIVDHFELLPPQGTDARIKALRDLKRINNKMDYPLHFDDTGEKIQNALHQEGVFSDSEDFPEDGSLDQQTERANETISERDSIECSVQGAMTESRDDKGARVFLINPEVYGVSRNLTRMHIQHLRQFLTQEKILDNFDPATTKVEILGDTVRVSTTDQKFQQYLASFVGDYDKVLEIPDRLQVVLDSE